ncbi:MAG TPA: hypothetical protein VGE74_02390, partial [Gemmata sp.]
MKPFRLALFVACMVAPILRAEEPKPDLRDEARTALKRAATFYRNKVASHGGYVYYYTPDLKQRWGEGAANPDILFV